MLKEGVWFEQKRAGNEQRGKEQKATGEGTRSWMLMQVEGRVLVKGKE